MPGLIIYGVPFSQPVRAVLWLLMLKIPFELVLTNPGSSGPGGSRHPDFLTKNPGGTIPCLEEPETGFTLGEAHAIMTYLSEKMPGMTFILRICRHAHGSMAFFISTTVTSGRRLWVWLRPRFAKI